jgi:hypothetical protein
LPSTANHECFGVLFDRHPRSVYNHCFRRTASWADAEEGQHPDSVVREAAEAEADPYAGRRNWAPLDPLDDVQIPLSGV